MDERFAADVAMSARLDPMPTLEALSRLTGVAVEDIVHHALVRYASDGAAALLALGPESLDRLVRARRAEDWTAVAAIVDWLDAGFRSAAWRHEPGATAGGDAPGESPPPSRSRA